MAVSSCAGVVANRYRSSVTRRQGLSGFPARQWRSSVANDPTHPGKLLTIHHQSLLELHMMYIHTQSKPDRELSDAPGDTAMRWFSTNAGPAAPERRAAPAPADYREQTESIRAALI